MHTEDFIRFVRKQYESDQFIALHEPRFSGNDKKYVMDAIDSTFVSSVGKYVDQFEKNFAEFVGSRYAVATVNGTAALHIALKLAGVEAGDEVIAQPLNFVATCNAISYCCAKPVFVDVDEKSLGLSSSALRDFLTKNTKLHQKLCYNKKTNRVIRACVPMHTFGHSVDLDAIKEVCDEFNIALVEDAAESLGSYYKNKHTGGVGKLSIFSFNGNKILTTGGGGMIVTNDESLAKRAKHLTTTAKISHPWEYVHDEVGYNYRLPNLNAALGCAQLEQLPKFLEAKRELARLYKIFFDEQNVTFITEPLGCRSNYWLNAVLFNNQSERDLFLKESNEAGIMTRPAWKLLSDLKMYKECEQDELKNARFIAERLVNIPSSVIL